ncbi:hypothetical protein AAFF_G00142530 [Aldrovandia affinis]|uniref:FK506-binding protein-like n=1 Tax=Aldrovandia affinis TaxID=143900 RepID=A0AAD7WWB7_9TELE|nr:hypothetical protein AAFF_G00142530 [Aldrovandia affinis]
MKTECDWEEEGGDCSGDVTSWVSACPGGLREVRRKRTGERGMGDHTPKMGSVCRIRAWVQTDEGGDAQVASLSRAEPNDAYTSMQVVPLPRSVALALQVPLNTWVLLRLGEGQCDVIEGCVEGMKTGEQCEVLVSALNVDSQPRLVKDCDGGVEREGNLGQRPGTDGATGPGQPPDGPLRFVVELRSFTPGRESWEMSPEEKWEWVRGHRERGGDRFREGDVWGAADCYSRALKLLITLKGEKGGEVEGDEPKGEEEKREERGDGERKETRGATDPATGIGETTWGTEPPEPERIPSGDKYDVVRAGLHANLSLCQLKLGRLVQAQRSGAKATELDPASAKAWYRLGQACCQVGELGIARAALQKVLDLQPGSLSALKALREVSVREKEQTSKLGHRLSKMFS